MRVLVLASLMVLMLPVPGWAQADFLSLQRRVVELSQEHEAALVRIKAVHAPEQEGEVPEVIIGTGFFVSREGLILTNASITREPERIWVEHRDISYSADLIGLDRRANLALLRVHTLPEDFRFFHLSDSPDLPPVGTFVLRLSMPLDFPVTPRFGMVEGQEARFGKLFFPCTYVRTSIPASPGDGGSAFVDLTGRLIGIQVGSLPEVGSTYVLPARAALRIRDDLLFSGEVTYGWIGFQIREESSVQDGRRLILDSIAEDTPASRVGLMPEDTLLEVGQYPVHTLDDLRNAMFYARVGQYLPVRVLRAGEPKTFSVEIVARPETEPLLISRDDDLADTVEPVQPTPERELPDNDPRRSPPRLGPAQDLPPGLQLTP